MHKGLEDLTEREKAALRLLLAGHDAKSTARELGLSVHTVNDRLRDARRKLGVTSSREAARLLGEADTGIPEKSAGNDFGVAGEGDQTTGAGQSQRRQARRVSGPSLVWLAGGMLIMSLIVAAVALTSVFTGQSAQAPRTIPVAASPVAAAETPGSQAARQWVKIVDEENWRESWASAGAMFRSQVTAESWAAQIKPVRGPLGAVSSRVLQDATRTTSLPGAPDGDYEVVQFRTAFQAMPNATETVILSREGAAWKVVGYFIR